MSHDYQKTRELYAQAVVPKNYPEGARRVWDRVVREDVALTVQQVSTKAIKQHTPKKLCSVLLRFCRFVRIQLNQNDQALGDVGQFGELLRDVSCTWNNKQFRRLDKGKVADFLSVDNLPFVYDAEWTTHGVAAALRGSAGTLKRNRELSGKGLNDLDLDDIVTRVMKRLRRETDDAPS